MNRSIDPFFPISISVFISPAMDGRALGARIAPLQGALVIGYRNRGKIDKSLDENATGHGGGEGCEGGIEGARLLPSRETVLVARAAGYGDADYSLI